MTEIEIGANGCFNISFALCLDHFLQEQSHFIDRLIGNFCRSKPRGLCFKKGTNAINISQSLEIELGDADAAVTLLDENSSRQKLQHGFANRGGTNAQVLHQLNLS